MRFCYLFLVVLLFSFCTDEKREVQGDFTGVSIEKVYEDSVSIRAILPVGENAVWFAGSNGRMGFIENKIPRLATVRYNDSLISFRSIAKTERAVFILSISSPAVLYKIGLQENEATSIEEVYVEHGEKVFYNSMKFWNNEEGIAMGDPVDGCFSIIMTIDGGNTWNKLNCSVLPPAEEGEAAFAASNSNLAVFGDQAWFVTGGNRTRVFYTPDKGKNWKVFDTPIQEGESMTGIYSVDFLDAKTGIIFGGDWSAKEDNRQNKALSKDGGKTWQLISDGEGPGYRSSARFIPGTDGQGIVAVGPTGISYSGNEGGTWDLFSEEGFFAIEFVNDSIAFASGTNKISKLIFKRN